MSAAVDYQGRVDSFLSVTPWQRLAAGLRVIVAGVVAVASVGLTGQTPNWLAAAVVTILLIAAVRSPDSLLGAVAIAIVIMHWWSATNGSAFGWALVPAVGVLVVHSGLANLAVTPPACALPKPAALRWSLRVLVVAGMTVAVWGMALWLDSADSSSPLVLTAAGFVALLVTAVAIGQRAGVTEV